MNTLNLALLVQDYTTSDTLKVLAVTTQKSYLIRLRHFAAQTETLGDMTLPSVKRYLVKIAATSPVSVVMYRSALKHFSLWLCENGYIAQPLDLSFRLPKATIKRRETVPAEHVTAIVHASHSLPFPVYRATLYRAALSIVVYGGLRRAELLGLHELDCDHERGYVRIRHGKGDKERKVYLPDEAWTLINAYRALRPKNTGNSQFLIWKTGRNLNDTGLDSIFRICCQIAGIKPIGTGKTGAPKYYTPHQFRHSYATRLLKQGAKLPVVQSLMGHTNMTTTAIYLHVDDDDLKAAAEEARLPESTPLPEKKPRKPQHVQKRAAIKGQEQKLGRFACVRLDGRQKEEPPKPKTRETRFIRRAA